METPDRKKTPFLMLRILIRIGTSAWGFPSFIIPKKDGRVRLISDFRILNDMIIREPHTLPRI